MPRLALALAALLALVAVATPAPAQREVTRPNVVVIMTDDQTVESLRVMRNVRHLLAERGTTFDNNLTSFPLCCPSRATFLTGQYSHNHQVIGNNLANGLARLDESNTLPVWLRAAGYDTVFVGKYLNQYGSLNPRRVPPGWNDWNAGIRLAFFNHTMNRNGKVVRYGSAESSYQSDVYTRIAVDAIRSRAREAEPLFLWLSYFAPHYGGPREVGDPLDLKSTVAAPRHRDRFLKVPLPITPAFNELDVSDKPAAIRARPLLGEGNLEQLTVTYRRRLQSLLAIDEGVAKVVAALKTTGRLDDTLILFTSDNGFLQGEHRVQNAKELPYEPSVRVPLIVRGPGVRANARASQLVGNVDLAPTIVAAAGATAGRVQDGFSLLPLFADAATPWDRDLLLERGPGGNLLGSRLYTGIRTQRYKYLEYSSGERELYDLQTDPYELESKQDDPEYAAVEAELAQRLAVLRDCTGDTCRRDY